MARPAANIDMDRRLVFRVGNENYEIDASFVLEVIRVPPITRVPHGPQSLVGIANRRGRPIPIIGMSRILDQRDAAVHADGKVIVYDHGGAVGLLVDDVIALSKEASAKWLSGLGEQLDVAFKTATRRRVEHATQVNRDESNAVASTFVALLSFRIADQLYGLPLCDVLEVKSLKGDVTTTNKGAAAIGIVSHHDGILPLISLAYLLGLDNDRAPDFRSRAIVIEYEGDAVGLVVEEIDVIRRLSENNIDNVPAVLQRGRGDAQIDAIGRADQGLLISILSTKKLFGHQAVTQAITQTTGAKPMATPEHGDSIEKFLIFQLGNESYGLPIGSVDEVIRVPDDITRVPGTPDFVLGVINLRGKPIALIDQRARFEAPESGQKAKTRAIIVTLGTLQAGFAVDGTSEIAAVPSQSLSPAPEFSSDQTGVFDRIAHLEADGQMFLLVDPRELLTRTERDIVAAITEETTSDVGT